MTGYTYLLWRHKLLLGALLALLNAQSTYLRVLIRSVIEGPAFQWGYPVGVRDGEAVMASGRGLLGHADHILVHGLVVAWLVWAGCRRADRAFRVALFGWTSIMLGLEVWFAATFGADMLVNKETIGLVNVPAVYIVLPPVALTWLLALCLLVQNRPDAALPVAGWTRLNTAFLGLGGLLLAGAAVMLNLGAQHGGGDLAGIVLIYMALTAAFLGLSPWKKKA